MHDASLQGQQFYMRGLNGARLVGLIDSKDISLDEAIQDFIDGAGEDPSTTPAPKTTTFGKLANFFNGFFGSLKSGFTIVAEPTYYDEEILYGETIVELAWSIPCPPAAFLGLEREYNTGGKHLFPGLSQIDYVRTRYEKMTPDDRDVLIEANIITREMYDNNLAFARYHRNLVKEYGTKPEGQKISPP